VDVSVHELTTSIGVSSSAARLFQLLPAKRETGRERRHIALLLIVLQSRLRG
jgi:hypothetical protein